MKRDILKQKRKRSNLHRPHSLFPCPGRPVESGIRPPASRMLICVCLLLSLLFPGPAAANQKTVYVKVMVALVRQAPSTEAPILFKARQGDPVVIKETQGDWHHIQHPNRQTGWAHKKLFTATAPNGQQTVGREYFIKSVNLEILSADREKLAFELDGFHPPETFVLTDEKPRVVCDFLNTRIRESIGPRVESGGNLIKEIRIAPYGGMAARVRIVLDLATGRHYEIDQTFYKKESLYVVTVHATAP